MTPHTPTAPWPVRTPRLTLRPATRDDLLAIGAYRRIPEVSTWLPTAPGVAEDHVRHISAKPERLEKTLVVELGDAVIGDLFLSVEDAWGQLEVADDARNTQAEVGWCLDPA